MEGRCRGPVRRPNIWPAFAAAITAAGAPWDDGRGFNILEYDGKAWVKFAKLSAVTREESEYPVSFYAGWAWMLPERFKYHKHWNDFGVQMYFATAVDAEASAINKLSWL
jgi:hypothetical protein